MQNFLGNIGGLLNSFKSELGLGALMYGSSQAQQGLKNMFGMPTTGDYIRQWEAQRRTPMQRAKVGQPMVLGGKLGYKAADGSWQPRGDMESENIPQYLPGSPQADKRGYVWDSSGQQAAADRAYQQEKSRVAQLTAQDPELKRYEDARKLAVAPGATEQQIQSAEDIGMQIWAQKNPGLAAKVKPGQAGYDVIQGTMAGQAAAQGYGYQMPQQIMMTPPPGVNVPQGLPAVQSMTPTETYGAQGLEVDPEMRKKFQALLDKTAQAQ